MYVVTVQFVVDPARIDPFLSAMHAQARNSLDAEPDCFLFDVCFDPAEPSRVFLYEKYTSEEAFKAHVESRHFRDFDQRVAPWVHEKRVRIWRLAEAPS